MNLKRISVGVISALVVVLIAGNLQGAQTSDPTPNPYQVVWDSPSEDWGGSMPIGNGEVAVNVWFDGQGRVHLLFARTDAWDDYGRLVKVGAVDVALTGGELAPEQATPFRQELDATTGIVRASYGAEGNETRVKVWVEPNRPNVVVEIESDHELAPTAETTLLRDQNETLVAPEVSDLWHTPDNSERVVVQSDKILASPSLEASRRVGTFHRNVKTKYYDEIAKTQGLDDIPCYSADPYVNRTFGILLSCDDAKRNDAKTLQGAPGRSRRFEIAVHTAQTPTFDEWLEQIVKIADEAAATPVEERRAQTEQYWRDFSERSWVRFSPNQSALTDLDDDARDAVATETFNVTRAYALQRYAFACQGRGNYPIKFNGGLFTHAHPGLPASHDYRKWGPGYWWQNTRLPYYTMLKSGDFDLMQPLFEHYCGLVPLCCARARKYLGVDGAYFPECIYLDGAVFPETYGLKPWRDRDDKLQASGWHKREWVGGLELAFLAIQYYEFTQDETFLKEKALPTANAVLKFFDSLYRVDPATGKMKMSPAQALETWWDCDDPAPEIAGIRAVCERLIALPDALATAQDRAFWNELLAKTPELPVRHDDASGLDALAAAARFEHKSNVETPELYSVFPFRLYSFEKPGAELARNAYQLRLNHYSTGWAQDDLFCAYLGDAQGARENLVKRVANVAQSERFPIFWGPNFDWIPDQDNGGILDAAVQSVALQTDGDRVMIAPALPKEWNVEFKLWAAKNTRVHAAIIDGKLVSLNVEPKSRAQDAVLCLPGAEKAESAASTTLR